MQFNQTIKRIFSAPTAKWSSGARRAAMLLLVTMLTSAGAWATITGGGTASDPYVINNNDDWNTFSNENNAAIYWTSGVYVKLATDIGTSTAVTTMVGTSSNKFKGTFDGGAHTLTISYDVNEDYVAPFRYVDGATIKDLHVTGSITTKNRKFAGGLMAEPSGNCTISNCRSSVAINSYTSGDGTHGGFIGVARGGSYTITINNCLFDGQLLKTGNSPNSCGGFVGWHEGKINFTGCYFNPSANITISTNNSATFARNGVTSIDHCYYKTAFGTVQGTAVGNMSATEICAALNAGGEDWQVDGNNVVPVMVHNPLKLQYATIGGVSSKYLYISSPISIMPTVTAADGTVLTAGSDYTVTIKNSSDQTVTTINATGDYTLTVTGKGSYTGSQSVSFTVTDCPEGLSVDNAYSKGEVGYYYVNMPANDTKTLTIPDGFTSSFKVYDDGGKGGGNSSGIPGNYSSNCNGYLIITAPTGHAINLSGNIKTQTTYDKLTVWNGTDTSDDSKKILDGINGTVTDINVISTGNVIMLYFNSNDGWEYYGLDLDVTLIDTSKKYDITINSVTGGNVAASMDGLSVTEAKWKDVVTLTSTPTNSNFLCDLSVKGKDNENVAVTDMLWYTDASTATFTMPFSAVTVTPTFTDNLTAAGGLYINMPKTGTKNATIPAGVQSFKLYDDGGEGGGSGITQPGSYFVPTNEPGNYSDNCNGYLVITAPEGTMIKFSGNIKTQSGDKLTVWNGTDTSDDSKKILDGISGKVSDIDKLSIGNVITVYFCSNAANNIAGLDFTVTIANPNDLQHGTITDIESSYNCISSPVSITPTVKAADGTTLTLGTHFTATLDDNNVSSFPFEIIDKGDHKLTVTGKGDYTGSQSVSFHVNSLSRITYDSEGGYFIMDEAQDFEDLADFVNAGNNCKDLTFKMTGPVQFGDGTATGDANHTPIGSDYDHSFAGTFDGQNNTISGLIVNATDYAGLFGYTDSYSKIQNVTITNSNISATGNYAGGFVGYAHGTNTEITNCHVTASVTVSATNYAGGILGRSNIQQSKGIIKNNSSAATVSGNQNVGGITGFGPAIIAKIEDCIYTGNSVTGTNNVGAITGEVGSSSNGVVNCYTTNDMTSIGMGENGAFLYSSTPATGLYYPVTIMDYTGYANCIVSNLYDSYLTDGITPTDIVSVVKDATGNEFTAGTDYAISYSPNASPIAAGNYTMTLTGVSANCGGSYTHDFTLVAQSFEGSGTQESPYMIATIDQLAQVAQYVNDGTLGSGSYTKHYKLTADLDYTGKTYTQIGTDANRFNGVFDGQGHTIKGITVEAAQPGLFGYIENATVKNLWLDNSSFTMTGDDYAGGFVCRSYKSTIENCHVSSQVTISKNKYWACTGGIVGLARLGTIRGCTSAVHMDDSDSKYVNKCGGILGYESDNSSVDHLSIYDNLYYGTQLTGEPGIFYYSSYTEGGKSEYFYRNLTAASCDVGAEWIHKATVVSCSDELTGTFNIVHNEDEDIREITYDYNGLKVVYNNNSNNGKWAKGIYFDGILYIHTSYKYTANLSPKRTGFTSTKYYRNGNAFSDSNGENGSFNSDALISWDSDHHYWDVVYGITLADNATTNADIIDTFDGAVCDVTLSGHKFYQDRDWNTICLPFDLDVTCNEFENSQIGDIRVMELDAANSNLDADGKLTLAFTAEWTTMKAGKPYIVRWPNGTGDILESPTITGVTIDKTERPVCFTNNKTSGDCQFMGNYAPLEITDANRDDILLLAAGNKLGYAKTDRTIENGKALGAFRAYFYITDDGGSLAAREFVLNFGDEEEATGIISIENGKSKGENEAGAIYDLQGRKVENMVKGLYIVNGKKVVVE
ncbi:MAG: hypothetical protein II844_10545 [Prevotella sp.]|nr:hypothetical protein [Prevotella sp.]